MRFDRVSKWLSGHFGPSMVWLSGERRRILACRTVQAEVVLPVKLPDGLFELEFDGAAEPELHLLETFIYPDRRAVEQIFRDAELVHADRRRVPEISVLTLRPRGRYRIPNRATFASSRGTTQIQAKWNKIGRAHV